MAVRVLDKNFVEFISEGEIAKIVSAMASAINRDYKGKNPYFLVMMNGAFMFASDILRKIEVDSDLAFVRYASYEGMTSTGTLKELVPIPDDVAGRDVVVLEDIVDTGFSMKSFLEILKSKSPSSIAVASFLVKPDSIHYEVPLDYVGKRIGDGFIVGYGLDYNGHGRNLGAIYVLEKETINNLV